jgi:hypothetical protein
MSTFRGYDRRQSNYATDDGTLVVLCRVCWAPVALPKSEQIEVGVDGRPFLRCSQCGGSFLIRRADAELADTANESVAPRS